MPNYTHCNLKNKISQWLMKVWYQKQTHWFLYLLLPFSFFYRLIIFLRQFLFQVGIKKTTYFDVPIIVIGNITLGGTGKTPLVIALAKLLQQKGLKVGIISRGYGGSAAHYPQIVEEKSSEKIVGDEALLLMKQTRLPIVVAPNRVQAAKILLKKFSCEIILSDDGLQHYALGRTINMAVLDGERRYGNRHCLPAGPLRESIDALKKVDFIVSNGSAKENEYAMQLLPGKIYNLHDKQREFFMPPDKKVHAVAAIGNPARFFNLLRQLGFNVIEHPFPDHYFFQAEDFNFSKDDIIMMTEKDAVKCNEFLDVRFWCLPVQATLAENFVQAFLELLAQKKFCIGNKVD